MPPQDRSEQIDWSALITFKNMLDLITARLLSLTFNITNCNIENTKTDELWHFVNKQAAKSQLVKVINFNRLLDPVAITLSRYTVIESGLCLLVKVSRLFRLKVRCTCKTARLVTKLLEVCVQRLLADKWQR